MNFNDLSEEDKKEMATLMFSPLSSPEELKDWVNFFLDIDLPVGIVDPDSTSSPIDSMWAIYNAVKNNDENAQSKFIMLSCRSGYKTLSASILETLLMIHWRLTVGHMASIKEQSSVAIGYMNYFFVKLEPLLAAAGWTNRSQNKSTIEFQTPEGESVFIKVVVCSPSGANSLHVQAFFIDEVDLINNILAYEESSKIPVYSKGRYPITVRLSTRKFAFGLMARAVEEAPAKNHRLLRWNAIDIAERCGEERHLPNLPKVDRYVPKRLPLRQISPEEYDSLVDIEKQNWELLKNVHAGCVNCKLLSVCKTRLADRPKHHTGGLYRPIKSIIGDFEEGSNDMNEAQLMCFSPKTQILMGDGTSKNISEVKIGDKVITHLGNVKKVTKIFKRNYEGNAYSIKNLNWMGFEDEIVTPEHPYFINGIEFASFENVKEFKFRKNGSLKTAGDYISLPIKYNTENLTEIKYEDYFLGKVKKIDNLVKPHVSTGRYIPNSFTLDENFGWILGYFLAEGHIIKDNRRSKMPNIGISFASDHREVEYTERVRNFAKKMGLTTSEFKAKVGNGYSTDIYNVALANLFVSLCGEYCDKKIIHKNLINSNLLFLESILEGFFAGDGTKRENCYKELTTTSYSLASQLFLIASRLGLCPRIKKKPNKVGKQAYLVWYINKNYITKQKRTRFKTYNNYNQYRIDKKNVTAYSGEVYNIEVEDDHSYIANGAAVHNCWRPSSKGLVYPRFESSRETGNVITIEKAYEAIAGITLEKASELDLLLAMKNAGVRFVAGVDWGYTHDFVIVIFALLANGEVWVMDCFSQAGLEFSDQLEIAKSYRDKYSPEKWWCDPAMPSSCVSFTKNGMRSPKFNKDVMGGIEALRSKIVDTFGRRWLKVLNTEPNQKVINTFIKHYFKLDSQGNPTTTPDDVAGIADQADAMRYVAQQMFPVKGTQKPLHVWPEKENGQVKDTTSEALMREEIAKRTTGAGAPVVGGSGKKGSFFWSM